MNDHSEIQLSKLLDHSNPDEILAHVRDFYRFAYTPGAYSPVANTLCHMTKLFKGVYVFKCFWTNWIKN